MFRTVCSALFVVAMVSRVDAQPSSAQAEMLFRQGKQLMTEKKFGEACEAFEGSQKLDPAIATLLNLADCREQNGQLATAWGLFVEAVRQTRGATDKSSVQLNKVATQRAAKLEPKLSKLTITVPPDAKVKGLQVARNGEAVDAMTWNRTLPVDGGSLTITARAAGYTDWTTTVTVGASGDTKSVTVPKLTEVAATPIVTAPEPTEKPAEPETETDEITQASSGSSKVVPIAISVGAVALLGGAVAFELSGRKTYDDAKAEPDDAKQKSLWDSANRKRYIAEGMAIGGIAAAGVAVWLFVRSSGSSETTTTARGVSVLPLFAAGGGGLMLDARY
jgi:hypothetical protein